NDGKIVLAGTSASRFALARYNTNGSLDTSFGSGGTLTTPINASDYNSSASALAIQPDGKIVAVGTEQPTQAYAGGHIALVRYNPDGTWDTSFGSGGITATLLGVTSDAR